MPDREESVKEFLGCSWRSGEFKVLCSGCLVGGVECRVSKLGVDQGVPGWNGRV